MVWDRAAADRIIKRVEDLDEAFRKSFDDSFEGVPFDMERVTDEEFREFFEGKLEEFPTATIRAKNGDEFIASPFVVALQLSENGDAMLRRYERITGAS